MKWRALISIVAIVLASMLLMTNPAYANRCTIQGFVWHDLDCDGIQDPGEPGVAGVHVFIIDCGPDGLPGTADDVVMDHPRTNLDGFYSLNWLYVGEYYYVRFEDFPPGFIGFSPQDQGADDTVDSDPDPSTGRTACGLCECTVECDSEPLGEPLVFDAGLCMDNGDLLPCPHTQGFWKNHPDQWPVYELYLGCELYDMDDLLELLDTPVRGDASLILAHQLIAAKLNIANGSDDGPISAVIATIDLKLCDISGRFPYDVAPKTTDGKAMVKAAAILDQYNNGDLTPGCLDNDGEDNGDCL